MVIPAACFTISSGSWKAAITLYTTSCRRFFIGSAHPSEMAPIAITPAFLLVPSACARYSDIFSVNNPNTILLGI